MLPRSIFERLSVPGLQAAVFTIARKLAVIAEDRIQDGQEGGLTSVEFV
jgi:hypothetical protein